VSRIAVRVEGLGKRYRLGAGERHGTLRDAIAHAIAAPFHRVRGPLQDRPARARTEFWALRDVSFEIERGEVVGVIGRNGAGKTTLLRILSRITEPTEGRAQLRGRVGSLLEVGTGFHPELSGRENIYLNGAIMGMRRHEIDRKFDDIVAFAELEEFVDTPVKRYSSGMYVRLAFAVAAHLESDIMLVDEILAVGDVRFQRKCLGKMDEVARDGRTVLFISHQMNQIRRLCGRSMWLDAGRLRAFGPTVSVTSAYEAEAGSRPRQAALADRDAHLGARFLAWEVVAPRGDRPNLLASLGPVTVRFLLQVNRPIRGGHHGIGLYDDEGRLLWGTATDGLRLDPGIHEIVYDLDALPVIPGSYAWHVTIFAGPGTDLLDSWQAVPDLVVGTEPLGHYRDECAGFLNIPSKVTVRPQAE
jgi:lipopolysaccharide transport system ATP-binding protein